MSSKTVNIIIIAYYLLTLLCGIDSIISNEVINNIRLVFQFGMPLIIVLMILYDNRKNLDIFKQNKISLIFMIANIMWMFITVIFGIHIGINSIKGLVNFSSMLLLIYLLSNVKLSKEQSKKIFKHILIAGLVCASYGIIQYIFRINLDTLSNAKYPGILGRINSTFYLATLYDKYMLLTFAFAGYNVIKNNSKGYMALFILSAINVILTFARAGLIGLIILLVIYVVSVIILKQYKKLLLPLCLVIIAFLIPGFKYSMQSTMDYLYDKLHIPSNLQIKLVSELTDSTGDEIKDINNDLSLQYRKIYENIGKAFIKEYPIQGIGYNNYSYLYQNQNAKEYLKDTSTLNIIPEYMYPHNGYIQLGAEMGIVGLILYFGYIIYLAVYNVKVGENKYKYFSLVLLLLFLLGCATETLMYNKQYLFAFAIIYSLYNNKYIKEK